MTASSARTERLLKRFHEAEPVPPSDQDVLDAEEARRYLRLGPRKWDEVRLRLPGTELGHRTTIYSRRLLLEWVEANADIVDLKQQEHRKRR
jgi:hypothetical protein